MHIPTYTPHQLVRIELVRYQNPEGLHPMEASYRDLCRTLIEHIETLQEALVEVKPKLQRYDKTLEEFVPVKFPQSYTGTPA